MTAIPEPTEEDKTVLLKIEQAYEEIEEELRICDYYLDGDKIADWKYEQRLIRLLSHYQRENERLARQRDVLREWVKSDPQQMPGNGVTSSEMRKILDALSGEGGAG